ncbi:MAG: GerMN domain-containing protein [Atribacterota bacterium]
MDEERVKRRRRRKRMAYLQPLLYIFIGVAAFFAVVYAGEYFIPGFRGRFIPTPSVSGEISPVPTIELGENEVLLYFSNEEFTALVAEKRPLNKTDHLLEDVVQELIKGPTSPSLYNPLPRETRLNGVFTEGGVVYVDLSKEMKTGQSGGTSQELLSIFCIVDSLTAIPDVTRVKILIDGKEETTLCGHIDLSEPLERDEKLIAEVQ